MASFAEQLAARAAAAKSHRERSTSSISTITTQNDNNNNNNDDNASAAYKQSRTTAALPGKIKMNRDSLGGLSFADRIKMASSSPGVPKSVKSVAGTRKSSAGGNDGESVGGSSFADKIRQKSVTLTPREVVTTVEAVGEKKWGNVQESIVSPLETSSLEVRPAPQSVKEGGFRNNFNKKYDAKSTQQSKNQAQSDGGKSILLPQMVDDELASSKFEVNSHAPASSSTPKQTPSQSSGTYPIQMQRKTPTEPQQTVEIDNPQAKFPAPQTPNPKEKEPSPPQNQQQDQTQPSPGDDTPTKVIFGAWAKIESLQQRVREAEERAKQESQRAELAQYELRVARQHHSPNHRHHNDRHSHVTLQEDVIYEREGHDLHNHDLQHDPHVHHASFGASSSCCGGMDDVSAMDEGSVVSAAAKSSSYYSAKSSVVPADNVVNTANSSIVSQGMNDDSISRMTNSTSHRNEHQPLHQQQQQEHQITNEIELWRQRALEAEERLAKERAEYSTAPMTAQITPPPTAMMSSASTIASHNHLKSNKEESELIILKNAEIDVLRSQIHRLERRIQEECERSMGSFAHHHHHATPPLVVATAARTASSSTAGGNNIEEFRLLRDEIRNLQYQLSLTKKNTTASSGSTGPTTAGVSEDDYLDDDLPTLSTLDGNEEVDEDEENGNSSSWGGLCCNMWRSKSSKRRGYGRTGVQPPGMA